MSITQSEYNLRDYQVDLINQIFAAWTAGHRRVMLQLATGGGKTVVFSHLARQFLARGEGVLVVAHRHELITQSAKKLEAIGELPVGVIKAGYPSQPDLDVQVASIQSIVRRDWYPDAGLVIVDEAHHSCSKSYTDLLDKYPNAYILGVTATPCRSDGQGFKKIYDTLLCGKDTAQLMEEGHLCRYELIAANKSIDTSGVKMRGGDYNLEQLAEAASESEILGDIVPTWQQHADNRRTIVFAVDIAHSKRVVELFVVQGIKAEHLDGETPNAERTAILSRFEAGETVVLSNCGIVSEGFDVPAIEAVQCLRPTASLGLWLQMMGRSLRPSPGKEKAIIIDHTGNWKCLGLPDQPRPWSLSPVSLTDIRHAQRCPQCKHIFRPLHHEKTKPHRILLSGSHFYKATCPNCHCEMEFQIGAGGEIRDAVVIAVDPDAKMESIDVSQSKEHQSVVDELVEMQTKTCKKKGWVYFRLLELENIKDFSLGDWQYVACSLGYAPGWAWHSWQRVQTEER